MLILEKVGKKIYKRKKIGKDLLVGKGGMEVTKIDKIYMSLFWSY